MMRVVVCIVGFNNLADVEQCLRALNKSEHRDFEVVICENGGARAVRALVDRLGSHLPGGQAVTIVDGGGNLGYAGGNNRCIAARSDADFWWILNPDTQPDPAAMGLLADHLAGGHADAAGGTLLSPGGRIQAYGGRWQRWAARPVSVGYGTQLGEAAPAALPPIDYILGASIMFTRHFLAVAGPMRDDYFLYGEEVEWCLRAKARGLRLGLVPAALIVHDQGSTTGAGGGFAARSRLVMYLDQRNKIHILRDTVRAIMPFAALVALAVLIINGVRKRAWPQLRYGLLGWLAGVAGRRGPPPWL
ncbi:MAG: glycosyltransferase [Sphingomonas sp.]|jgi:hypothetical protein